MRTYPGLRAMALAVLAAGTLLLAGCYPPEATTGPSLEALDVWARAAQATMTAGEASGGQMRQDMAGDQVGHAAGGNSAIYLKLANRGPGADRLVGAGATVAQAVEIHETRMEGDVMTMQQATGGIEIPAGGQVELKPGGYHIMLIGLTQDLVPGEKFAVTLEFAQADPITVEAEVRQP